MGIILNQRCDLRHLAKLSGSHGVPGAGGEARGAASLLPCVRQAPQLELSHPHVSGAKVEEPHSWVSMCEM